MSLKEFSYTEMRFFKILSSLKSQKKKKNQYKNDHQLFSKETDNQNSG